MLEEVDLQSKAPGFAESSFRRMTVYQGIARELGSLAFNLAMWPVGLADEAVRAGVRRMRKPSGNGNGKVECAAPEAAEVPILLLHGYFHNRSAFVLMQRALRKKGFQNVEAFSYNPLRKGIPEIADKVACRVGEILDGTGASKLHLVGHSLGGLLARYYAEEMGGSERVMSITTLGTPHYGTIAAYASRSPTAKQMRPGSELLARLASRELPHYVRYTSYYSNLDALVVPSESAVLSGGNGNVRNIRVRDLGHLSLLISPELIESVVENLSPAIR